MTTFAEHVQTVRAESFAGRAAEMRLFRTVLTRDPALPAVLHVHGPGGIGKTALLHRYASVARAAGRPVTLLDNPEDVPAAVAAASDATGPVLLVDAVDATDRGDSVWLRLRDTHLPRLPAGAVVVVAGRRPPDADWLSDPGWSRIFHAVALAPLAPAEVESLLDMHGLTGERRTAVADLGCGNPFALNLAARMPAGRDLTRAVLARVVGDIPSAAHRRALDVCAHAYDTTEELLRAAIPDADATALFDWLCDRPFIHSGDDGLYPAEVVRRALGDELRWRDPDTYRATHAAVKAHLLHRARTASDDRLLAAIRDVTFTQRLLMSRSFVFDRGHDLREHPYRASDREAVLAIARATEGSGSAAVAAFWLDHRPDAVTVYRAAGDESPTAFLIRPRLTTPTAAELSADPAVAAAWRHVQHTTPLRPGEHFAVMRFAVDARQPWRPSASMDLMQIRCAAEMIRARNLAWHFIVAPTSGFWAEAFTAHGSGTEIAALTIGGRDLTVYAADWRVRTSDDWHSWTDDRMLSRRTVDDAGREQLVARPTRLEFDTALRDVLRHWRRPDLLADSPLLRGRPVAVIKENVEGALGVLAGDPRHHKFSRAVRATYLIGVPTQEAAAERLGLPFSTYRRHLGRGLSALADILWKQEMYGVDPAGAS
ncbi:hypothetical protein [Actinoplanes rectilineatus]|uniref:hypothetical protein n=1 Tax=Actinoplanes rectilineatus TaxID=113571 RepID=UPI0005F2FC25|nr:hypothetical protein [Actinoplanes rectilineatus]